ncbi:MAG: TonB-dependent receptor, partial [Prevotella sp.]|nr:TonB-dependent receptor [Prevotella sp.]
MKIGLILLFSFTTGVFATELYSQTTNVSIKANNSTVKDIIQEIEKQTDFLFVYNPGEINLVRKVSVAAQDEKILSILSQVFDDTDVIYVIEGKNIVLLKRPIVQQSDKKQITGKVTDSQGEPIIGVNVVEKGTSNGIITDFNGNFSLSIDNDAVLQFTYIGYISHEVNLRNISSSVPLSVVLREDLQALEEVVVVGYGVQKKVNLTGAISVVDDKVIQNRPLTNASQALQGVQGVYFTQAGTQPGKDAGTIRIRGVGTLNNNDPLVLVDGISSSISDVNPNDIANISVLKDAASSAIYGSRAANGVILITTKTGNKDEFRIEYNNLFGVQQVTYLPDAVWNPILFMKGWNDAYENEGKALLYSDEIIKEYQEGIKTNPYVYPATNWFDIAFNDAFTMEHNIRMSGGSEKLLLSMSLGYLDQDGVLIGTDNQRLSININGVATIGNLRAGVNLSGIYKNYNEPHLTAPTFMNYTMRSLPVFTQFLENGSYGRSWLTTPGQNTFYNLTGHVNEGENNHKETRILGNLFAEYSFPFNIDYKMTFGIKKYDEINRIFTPIVTTYQPKTMVAQHSGTEQTARAYSYNNIDPSFYQTLNWSELYGKHDVSALFGMSYEEFNTFNFNTSIQGFLDNSLTDISTGSKNQTASGAGNKVKLLSYFGRVNYVYDNRYLLETNFRYDGSSRFAPKHRWGFFPSFSAGWRINQENFLKETDWLSNLKLRGSWGELGNQEIGLYRYIGTIALGQNSIFGNTINSGGAVTTAIDPNITWETTTITNIGFDFGFWNNALSGTFEFFRKRTADILRTVNIPSQIGNLGGPTRNIGTVDNKGFEASLSYKGTIDKLDYNIYGNLTYVKNKVIDINDQEIINGRHIIKEGYPIDAYYLYICDGIFQSEEEVAQHATQSHNTKPGDIKFRDVDNDGKITEKDRVVTGNVIPKFTYSFGLNLDYHGLGLNVFFQGVSAVDTYPTSNLAQPYNNGAGVTYEWLD